MSLLPFRMACHIGCGACISEGYEDGVLCGNSYSIDDQLKKTISIVFQQRIQCGKINGKKNALEFCESVLTYDQLEDISTTLSYDIRDRIGKDFKIQNPDGDPIIAIIAPNSEKAIVLIMAILKTGAAYLPLDEEYPDALLRKIVQKFRPILIIADENNKHDPTKLSDLCQFVTLAELWNSTKPGSNSQKKASTKLEIFDMFKAKDTVLTPPHTRYPAVVLHTQGFYQNPYGVRISHSSILNRCIFEWNQLNFKENQSCSLVTNLSQVDSVAQIFSAILEGCTIVIFRREDFQNLHQFLKDIAIKRINRLEIPYYHLHDFLNAIEVDESGKKKIVNSLKCLKYVVCRGGYIRHIDLVRYFEMFKHVPICNCTGSVETSGDIIYDMFTSARGIAKRTLWGRLTLGRVMQNTKIYILGQEFAVMSDGNQGELCISGLCLGIDYVDPASVKDKIHTFVKNQNEETSGFEKIYRSGEFGRIIKCRDGKRRLYIEGRDDRVVRRKGHEFHVDDVMPFLKEFSFVKSSYLYILNKGKPHQEMVVFLLVKPAVSVPDISTIEEAVRAQLPDWAMPDELILIKSMPRHYYNVECPCCLIHEFRELREPKCIGWEKQLTVAIEDKEAAILLVKSIFKMTSTPVETIIASLNQTFYDLGGTSLNTVTFLLYLNKCGYPITLVDFYSKSNLKDLISLMTLRKLRSSKTQPDDKDSKERVKPNFYLMPELKQTYVMGIIKKRDKDAVIRIIATAYCEKSELAKYNMINYQDLEIFLTDSWNSYTENQLSIVVTQRSNRKVVGVAMCQDFFKLVDTSKASGTLYNVMEFYEEVKGNILLFLPHRIGETLEITWLATHKNLDPEENVKIITMLHTEIIKLARQNYSGIFHSAPNLLSRTLCTEVLGYEIFEDFQINKYQEFDGSRPFHLASDTAACAAMYLKIRDPHPPSAATSVTVIDPVEYFNSVSRKKITGVTYYHP